MSDPKIAPAGNRVPVPRLRRLVVRIALILVYLCIMVLVFTGGKGHTILIDNKDVEASGLTAFEEVSVAVDGQEAVTLSAGDRDMFKVTGQKHRVTLEVTGGTDKVVKEVTLPLTSDMIVLNLPKFAKGIEPVLDVFVPAAAITPDRDSESFTSAGQGEATTPGNQMSDAPITPTP